MKLPDHSDSNRAWQPLWTLLAILGFSLIAMEIIYRDHVPKWLSDFNQSNAVFGVILVLLVIRIVQEVRRNRS